MPMNMKHGKHCLLLIMKDIMGFHFTTRGLWDIHCLSKQHMEKRLEIRQALGVAEGNTSTQAVSLLLH